MKSFFSKLSVLLFGVAFAVAGCQDYDEDIRKVNDQLNANTAELTSITDALDKAIKDLEAKMVADYATKKALADLSAELKAEIDADVAAAQAAIDAAYKAADAVLKAGYESADAALKTELEGKIAAAIKAAQDANDELAATFERALNQMKNSIDETNSMINDVVVPYFQGEIDKINNAIKDLKAADLKNAEDIAKVAADLATAKTEITAAYTAAIKTAVEKLEGKIAEQATALAALKTLHQNDVILLQAAIAENSTDINALKLALKDHIADYKTTVEQLQGAIAEGDEEVKRILTNNLNAHIELYEQTVEDLQGAIGENTAEIELVKGLVRDLTALHTQDVADLQAAIAENTTLAEGIRTQLINHIAEYKTTVEQLQGAIGENSAAITANVLAINSLKTLHETDIQNLQDVIVILQAALEQETAQRKAADEELAEAIEELAALHATDIQNLQDAMVEADEALRQQLASQIAILREDYEATVEQLQNAMSELDAKITANFVAIKALENRAAEIEQSIADLDAAYKAADEALRADIVDINKVLDQFANNFTSVQFQIDFIVAALEQTIADLNALEVNVGVLTERVQSLVYVPEYNDAKATINYGIAPYITAEQKVETAIVPAKSVLRYKVNSTSETAVADIVRAFAQDPSILTYDLENVKLRSAAPELQVVSVREDEQGYLEVTALAKNFAKEFYYITLTEEVKTYLKQHISQNHPILDKIFGLIFGSDWGTVDIIKTQTPSTSYSAALVLAQADKKNNVASEFTNLIPAKNYGVLNLAARYTNEGKAVVIDSNFGDVVAERNIVKEQFIPSYDTVKVVKTCANEPVIKVIGDDLYYTVTELYNKYGYAVELQKTHQVVSYTKDGKMDLTQQAAPAWNTELVSYNTDKFIVVDAAATAIGTSREVSLTAYPEKDKVKYDQRVGNYVEVVDAYYLAGQTVAVADKVTITKNLVYINFDAKTYDWTLAKAIALRGDDKTPYAKSIVLNDVNYDNIYNLNPIVSDASATKTVTLNGKPNTTVFELSDIVAPEAGKAGRADITIKAGYEFAAANAENANEYVLTWKASLNETTDAVVTINVTLGKYPAAVTVESEVDLDLVAGQTYFDGKDALIADAYAAFGAANAGFATGAKANDIMFAALTDEANTMKNDPNSLYNLNFVVADNVDNSWVRLYESQIVDNANVAASYVFKRDITTWFGVPFKFIVTAKPHLPEVELVRSTEYASATDEAKVYSVNLQARINGEGIYNVVQSDLAFYLNTIGAANATQKVTFKVIEGEGEIAPATTVNVEPLATPINNPLVGDVTAYLQKEQSILKWTDHGTQIKVKATLWAGAYPVDYATLILNVEDPITFSADDIVAERIVEADTPVKVYSKFSLMSTAKTLAGVQAHKGNLIKTDAETIAGILTADVIKAYGIKIETELVTMYEQVAEGENGKVLYDASKYSWDKNTGILTLKKDDAAELLNPIVAQIRVKFTHNVHGSSDACTETSDIFVTFQQTK